MLSVIFPVVSLVASFSTNSCISPAMMWTMRRSMSNPPAMILSDNLSQK